MNGLRPPQGPGTDASLLRVPPHNLEAEQAVLASILLNNDLMNPVVEILRAEDFYQGAHRTLFGAMQDLYERGRAIDQLTLATALKDKGMEGEAGGLAYLSDLIQNVPTTANVVDYARLVKNSSILRKTIAVAQEITTSAFQGIAEVDDFLDRTEQAIFAIAEEKIKPSFYTMAEMAKESMKEIEKLFEKKELITGVPSGYRDLDQLTSGFQNSDMIIVAARPGMGKTAFCLNVAQNVAIRHKTPVAIFSLEMSRQQLALRMICSDARVNSQRLRRGYLAQDEMNRIVASVGRLSEAPIYIDDSGSLNALELRAKARRLKKDKHIGLLVIDYLQLMRGTSTRSSADNRVQEISEISRSLKALAKELNVPMMAISQLNRGVENRNDKRPQIADLRECVTGDTLVMTSDGCRTPIRDLVGKEVDVWAMSPEGRTVPARSDRIWSAGRKPVIRVSLASGHTIRATSEHLLYGAGGWVRVRDLMPGDRLAVARSVPEPSSVIRWPEERIILLGHLVGDGSYLVNQPMRYATASEDNSRAVEQAARNEFGAKVTRYRGRGKWHQLLISGNGNRWHPAGVNLWLRELGIFGQRSHEKRLPQTVFRLANDQIALLLRHLWATDGSICCRAAGSKGSARVYFCTSSEGLARDVAALLLRLGIVSRVRAVHKANYRPVYTVDVSGGDQQKRFLESVGAFGPRIAPADKLWNELAFVEANTNVDTLPKEVFLQVKAAMAEKGISGREMAALRGVPYGGNAHFSFSPSRTLMVEYAKLLDDDTLHGWAARDLFWDRVIDLSPDGVEDVFDLTVPGPACWLADGIISHNSGALEQDADLILFIYREEMYLKAETPDDKKGVAEVIIGKHRNGPMGEVNLAFLSPYTRFEDLAKDYE
ncbi:MAG: replicative DNA helicase [Deltaproteobacteria bacterium]|nr:replicative DNA helicase [Deltaproteobacteria bacterium]